MKLLRETTEWSESAPKGINHVYIFNGSSTKVDGYIPAGSTVAQKFSKPLMFDKRGRTFAPDNESNFDMTAFKG